MDGFSVKNANRFLQTGDLGEFKSFNVGQSSQSQSTSNSDGASFADTLNKAVTEVNDLQKTADKAMQNLAAGKTDNIPEVMIAAEKADIALKLMVQVRNKMIDAYQEVMKMQV